MLVGVETELSHPGTGHRRSSLFFTSVSYEDKAEQSISGRELWRNVNPNCNDGAREMEVLVVHGR
jgi:hypothetical protein